MGELDIMAALSIENARALLTALVSWRTLALLLAILNLKNLPFAWHVSLPLPPLLLSSKQDHNTSKPTGPHSPAPPH